jgi:hypothetical protein
MKDRASGSIGRRLIWSGRVVFIGRDAAFEGVIANVVTADFHRVTHRAAPVPLGSRDREVRYRPKSYATPWVGGRPRQHSARDHYGAGRGHD